MTSPEPYGQHTWHYAYNNEAKTEITFRNHHVFCTEVVEEMATYLMGVGYFQSNIIEAFELYVDEHKQAIINGAKRLEGMVGESQ